MIRPFQLRDVAIVRRLSPHGIALHTETALTNRRNPLRTAVRHLIAGGPMPTYVWKRREAPKGSGFIQMWQPPADPHARITFLGVGGRGEGQRPDVRYWLPLLDDLVAVIGHHGVHSLEAEVDETGEALPILRQAGFAVYTRQEIWRLAEPVTLVTEPALARRRAEDDWDIQLLYANTVPRLIQLVEPDPPLERGALMVLREGEELAAFVHVAGGPSATWLRFFLNPNATAQTEAIIRAALAYRPPTPERPVYCCVRRYQSWLNTSLESIGFAYYGSQAVMVRHTVQRIESPLPDLATMLEKRAVGPGSSTVVQRGEQLVANGHHPYQPTPTGHGC